MNKTVVILCEANQKVGLGHLMRCTSLSEAIARIGHEVIFAYSWLSATTMTHFLANNAKKVIYKDITELPKLLGPMFLSASDAQCLIVDDYTIRKEDLNDQFFDNFKICKICDKPENFWECDVLIDQTLHRKRSDYRLKDYLEPEMYLGARFVMLRDYVKDFKKHFRYINEGSIRNICISLGGAKQPQNVKKVLSRVLECMPGLEMAITVIVHKDDVAEVAHFAKKMNMLESVVIKTTSLQRDFLEFFRDADLVIGTASVAVFERLFLGVPSISLKLVDNQADIWDDLKYVSGTVACELSGLTMTLNELLITLNSEPDHLNKMSEEGMVLIDGLGANRIIEGVLS